jgi:hypothetical protein
VARLNLFLCKADISFPSRRSLGRPNCRQNRTKTNYPSRIRHLYRWMYHPNRLRQLWYAHCRSFHRRILHRSSIHDCPHVPSRNLATPRSRSALWLDTDDDLIGFLRCQLVSRSIYRLTIANRLSGSVTVVSSLTVSVNSEFPSPSKLSPESSSSVGCSSFPSLPDGWPSKVELRRPGTPLSDSTVAGRTPTPTLSRLRSKRCWLKSHGVSA